jgi:D-alanyl-D-alanine carboxypeptidase (penicillin-binding protein 5/6)
MFSKKARRFHLGILSLGFFGLLFQLPAVTGPPPPILDSPSYLIMDPDTQTIIFGRRIHAVRAPASTTKIMTILLALELGNLDDLVTISARATQEDGACLGLVAGERIPLGDLCYATIVKSGNDGAVAIAEHIGGSVDGFALLMNNRAEQLGMDDSHFVNPNGMPDDDHHSSAFDLALCADEAMKHDEFRRWVSSTEVQFDTFGNRQDVTFESTNHLLDVYPFATGIKTGYTDLAGFCLVASATFRQKTMIAVVLGCERNEQWQSAIDLFDYAFSQYDPDYLQFRDLYRNGGIF